jgi:hypothetical protein
MKPIEWFDLASEHSCRAAAGSTGWGVEGGLDCCDIPTIMEGICTVQTVGSYNYESSL